MAWIDERIFRPMIGVYYGIEPERIDHASDALEAALEEMGDSLSPSGWLVGEAPTLAEAVLVPLYVRLDGLRRLGFTGDLTTAVETHRLRMWELSGWPCPAGPRSSGATSRPLSSSTVWRAFAGGGDPR
jgi:glutathione S-transferase